MNMIVKTGAVAALVALTGCMTGEGVEVGQHQGRVLYQAECQVEQSTIGTRNILNGETFHEYGTCVTEAENRSGEGNYDIIEAASSQPYSVRSQYPVGGMIQTLVQTYKTHTAAFACKA